MTVRVYNPHPRLVNVAQPGGRFVRIAPLETAEVDEKLISRELKSGVLVKSDEKPQRESRDRESKS